MTSFEPFYLVKDGLKLSDSISELFVSGAKRLQLILQLSLFLLGETKLLKLLPQLRATLKLLLNRSGVRQVKHEVTGRLLRQEGTQGGIWNNCVYSQSKSKDFTCRSCFPASSNSWILPCRASISFRLAVIFSCMSMALWRPKVEAKP